jgi:hypothetical protein
VKKKASKDGSPMELLILSRLDSFEASVRSLDTKVGDLVSVTVKQEENLKEHMRRSDLLEERIKEEAAAREKIEESIDSRLKPVEKHVNFVDVTIKLATALVLSTVAILGLIEGFARLKSMLP